ncbi:hypothetical protein BP5796_11117 [Coleophoma crateriformis]|uniref:Uncharacterized protein n=1 Tax=Coleophoma crateriformis TaxID=565419 RepID=A0A3D8QLZ2_9HELO|nr:hypothetical protein BP5796_11117 [Coleophoma crateriformis]
MARSDPHLFIIATPLAQPDATARRNARSYAMRGKNRGKRRKDPFKQPGVGSWINGECDTECRQGLQIQSQEEACSYRIPARMGSAAALVPFAGEIEPSQLPNVFKFFDALEQTLYVNQSFVGVESSPQKHIWFSYLCESQTCVHTQLFVALAYFHSMNGGDGDVGPVATMHMTKALHFLQQDLARMDRATTEATISAVISLCMVAVVVGDTKAAESHIRGFFQLVTMRGGLRSFGTHKSIQIKCCRLDLGYAMHTCAKPLFFTDGEISWKSHLFKGTTLSRNTAMHLLCGKTNPDPRLVNVWLDLYEFSKAVNIATQTGRTVEFELFQETMISIQYRLLHLDYLDDKAQELLRIVMLEYATKIYPPLFSHFSTAPMRYPSLRGCLQYYLTTVEQSSNEQSKALLWLITTLKLLFLDDELKGTQLSQILQVLNLSSWDEVLAILKGFLWIDVLHKEQAKALFDKSWP